MSKVESKFQSELKTELQGIFPGCVITKLDTSHFQGCPDLLILFNNKWATLECKRASNAAVRPNQEYYVNMMDSMSFSRFINPDNKDEVINDLKAFFGCW